MARYGCLLLAVVVATLVLFFIVYLWSGWLNRPVGHSPPPVASAKQGLCKVPLAAHGEPVEP